MTITATPPLYSSLHGDIIFTVSEAAKTSDPTTYPNYKFIGDVYVGATLVARIKKVQDPITGIGIFNIGQVVRNYITTVFSPAPSVLVAQQMGTGVFNLTVTMKFGEEYSFTPAYDIVTDTARVYFNHYNRRLIGNATQLAPAFPDEIASNSPMSGKVFFSSAFYFVPYFATTVDPIDITITPVGGGTVYTGTFTPSAVLSMQVMNLSPQAINAFAPGTINSSTTSYTVEVGFVGISTYEIKIICEAIHDPYTLHFLNQYSGFETKIFSKVSRKTYGDIQRKDFGKLPYVVAGDGSVTYKNTNGVYNESRSVYSEMYKEKLELNTDLLTDAEYRWLADLVLSPMVYMEEGGYFFPIVITGSSYEFKKVVNDDLTNLNINIEFGTMLNSQFR